VKFCLKKIALAFLFILLIVGCSAKPANPTNDILAGLSEKASQMAENILTSIKTNDYSLYIRDMDETMKNASTQESFNSLKAQFDQQLGGYKSFKFNHVVVEGNLYSFYYDVVFEKATVSMQMVLTKSDQPLVSGLWFK